MFLKKYFFNFIIILIMIYPIQVLSKVNDEKQEINHQHVEDELLIKFKNIPQVYKINYSGDINKAIRKLDNNPLIDYAEPNYLYQSVLVPNDTYYADQWALEKIKAPSAWDTNTGDAGIVIAILDSGVDLDHPDLINNIWMNQDEIPDNGLDDDQNGYTDDFYGWDFIEQSNNPNPKFSGSFSEEAIHHGTAMAGVASAIGNNSQGIAGVDWSSKIMAIRVLDGNGVGDTLSVSQGIDYAVSQGADIINLSFVGDSSSQTLIDAIKRADEAGVVILAAAGNENINLNESPRYPVCHDNVIGVAATDQLDQKAGFSNYGSDCIDISAPGVDIFSTIVYEPSQGLDQYYLAGWYGTSLAAPYVAGAIGLIKSQNPNLTSAEIIEILFKNADQIDDENQSYAGQLGHGRLNIASCLTSPEIERIFPKNIIVGPGFGAKPQVKVLDKEGKEISSFYGYSEDFKGGVRVAAGDVDGDNQDEIITGTGLGGGPQVRVFEQDGKIISSFFAYATNFRGGVNVAVGDLDGDGLAEIITGTGNGGGPQVRIFDRYGKAKFTPGFFAYGQNFRGGVLVSCGDLDNDGQDEIITGTGLGGGPQVRIFNRFGQAKFTPGFFAYGNDFRGGVYVSTGDLNGDGEKEIITGTGFGGGPQVRIFDRYGKPKFTPGFFAYDEKFRGGVVVASGDVDADRNDEIITAAGPGGGPHVRILDLNGNKKYQFFPYETSFHGGVFVNLIYENKK